MIRNRDDKAIDIYNQFTSSVATCLDELDKKYDELKKLKETERTRAHWTYKIISNYFNKRGGTTI